MTSIYSRKPCCRRETVRDTKMTAGCHLGFDETGNSENGWRYRLGSNGPPIGNDLLGFEWSRN